MVNKRTFHFGDGPAVTKSAISRKIQRTKAEGGRRKAESGRQKAESRRRRAESGRRRAEGGRRRAEGGRRKAEGGRRKAESRRRKAKAEDGMAVGRGFAELSWIYSAIGVNSVF